MIVVKFTSHGLIRSPGNRSGRDLWDASMSSAWQQQATAQRRMEVGGITRYLFLAMQNMRIERGTVQCGPH